MPRNLVDKHFDELCFCARKKNLSDCFILLILEKKIFKIEINLAAVHGENIVLKIFTRNARTAAGLKTVATL